MLVKNSEVKFHVIVPTRERADTLLHCLRSIVAQDYENLHIIVSDNFSQDNTKDITHSFSDDRITYVNTGKRLSMSHNWEFALSHATDDGWVTFLGDDDGLLPGALKRISQVILETKCSAVTSGACVYNWESDMPSAHQLTVPLGGGIEVRNGMEWLGRLMRWEVSYQDLPWLYHGGFAKLSSVNAARDSEGRFFLSMIPDVYSAVALASTVENYIVMKEPICVSGVSAHSNGASTLRLTKNRSPAEKFLAESNIPVHPILGSPCIYSIPIIAYECYLQAMHLHKDKLRIDLSDQLGGILQLAAPNQYAELKEYCCQVAIRNEIPPNVVVKKCMQRLRVLKWKRRLAALYMDWKQITVNARDFEVYDVYGATLLAKSIYTLKDKYKHWRWKIALSSIKRVWHFLWKIIGIR